MPDELNRTASYSCLLYLLVGISFCWISLGAGQAQNAYQTEIDSLNELIGPKHPDTLRVIALNQLGKYYSVVNPDTVIPVCEQALALIDHALTAADSTERALLLSQRAASLANIAFMKYLRGQYQEAIPLWGEALQMEKRTENDKMVAMLYNNLGQVYSDMENYPYAQYCWLKSLEVYQALQDTVGLARIYNNFGYLYRTQGSAKAAARYYRKGLELRLAANDRNGAAMGYNNIGYVFKEEGQYDSAVVYFLQGLALWEIDGRPQEKLSGAINLGEAYTQLGRFPEALAQLKIADSLEQQNNWLSARVDVVKLYAAYYESQGEYQKALFYAREQAVLQDSFMNIGKQREILKQEMEFEFQRKEEVREANRQQELAVGAEKNKRYTIFSLLVGIGLLMALIFSGVLIQRIRLVRKQKRIIEQQSQELEMEALQAQMNPHFIFNSLNSIKHYVIQNDTRQAVNYLNKFARLIRYVLENSREKLIPLDDELAGLENYMELERIRFEDKFSYNIHNEIADKHIEVPPMVLQPFVENSIWHGVMPLAGKGKIEVRVDCNEEVVWIEIEDNGIGRTAALAQKKEGNSHKKSMGLSLSQNRLELLKLMRGQAVEVKFHDLQDPDGRPKGTLVRIEIAQIDA